ncbi:MAG: hypothetical protein FWD01_02885, partial [Defluviitaleaceae bacterium]|nr:hypothetical protein [Defluviitaleaceae bacterium]
MGIKLILALFAFVTVIAVAAVTVFAAEEHDESFRFSYNELITVMDTIRDFLSNNMQNEDIVNNFISLSMRDNRVVVELRAARQEDIALFRENVIDSPAIIFARNFHNILGEPFWLVRNNEHWENMKRSETFLNVLYDSFERDINSNPIYPEWFSGMEFDREGRLIVVIYGSRIENIWDTLYDILGENDVGIRGVQFPRDEILEIHEMILSFINNRAIRYGLEVNITSIGMMSNFGGIGIGLLDTSEEQIALFREVVTDSPMVFLRQAFPATLGDEVLSILAFENLTRSVRFLNILADSFGRDGTGRIIFPDWLVEMHINQRLILFIDENRISRERVSDILYIILGQNDVVIDTIIFPHEELQDINIAINSFIRNNPQSESVINNFVSATLGQNRVIVELTDTSEKQTRLFRENVIDSPMIRFVRNINDNRPFFTPWNEERNEKREENINRSWRFINILINHFESNDRAERILPDWLDRVQFNEKGQLVLLFHKTA